MLNTYASKLEPVYPDAIRFSHTRAIQTKVVQYLGDKASLSLISKFGRMRQNMSDWAPSELVLQAISQAKVARKDKPTYKSLPRPSLSNSKMHQLAKMIGIMQTTVVAFDLLAGKTCPFADICRSHVEIIDGHRRVVDSKSMVFRCYAAKLEAAFTDSYNLHYQNTQVCLTYTRNKDVTGLALEIMTGLFASAPNLVKKGGIVRVHASGDFYNKYYRRAWEMVAKMLPQVVFFGYSKGIDVVNKLNRIDNVFFIHSHGSRQDDIASANNMPQAFVRTQPTEYVGMQTVCPEPNSPDDFMFVLNNTSFALDFH
jgi:hypothetical protein